MSFKVLVVPEDFTKDEHILQPLVRQILIDAGKPNAVVQVCRNPNFQGISEALKVERLRCEVVQRYPMVDLFLLFVDRDGNLNRRGSLDQIESTLRNTLKSTQRFLAALAIEEMEIFPLAGHSLDSSWRWQEIRSDANVKNTWFKKLVEREKTSKLPHEGRKKLMADAMKHWARIGTRCPEEVQGLTARIRNAYDN